MDLLTTLGRQFHASRQLVRLRASRNPNDIIEKESTFAERIADSVARFGGSWTFIIAFSILITVYTLINVILGGRAWDPYPFILLNLFLSMLAAIQARATVPGVAPWLSSNVEPLGRRRVAMLIIIQL